MGSILDGVKASELAIPSLSKKEEDKVAPKNVVKKGIEKEQAGLAFQAEIAAMHEKNGKIIIKNPISTLEPNLGDIKAGTEIVIGGIVKNDQGEFLDIYEYDESAENNKSDRRLGYIKSDTLIGSVQVVAKRLTRNIVINLEEEQVSEEELKRRVKIRTTVRDIASSFIIRARNEGYRGRKMTDMVQKLILLENSIESIEVICNQCLEAYPEKTRSKIDIRRILGGLGDRLKNPKREQSFLDEAFKNKSSGTENHLGGVVMKDIGGKKLRDVLKHKLPNFMIEERSFVREVTWDANWKSPDGKYTGEYVYAGTKDRISIGGGEILYPPEDYVERGEVPERVKKLNNNGIIVQSSYCEENGLQEDGLSRTKTRTGVWGMRENTIDGFIALKNGIEGIEDLIYYGGSETGHFEGYKYKGVKASHGGGFKIDIAGTSPGYKALLKELKQYQKPENLTGNGKNYKEYEFTKHGYVYRFLIEDNPVHIDLAIVDGDGSKKSEFIFQAINKTLAEAVRVRQVKVGSLRYKILEKNLYKLLEKESNFDMNLEQFNDLCTSVREREAGIIKSPLPGLTRLFTPRETDRSINPWRIKDKFVLQTNEFAFMKFTGGNSLSEMITKSGKPINSLQVLDNNGFLVELVRDETSDEFVIEKYHLPRGAKTPSLNGKRLEKGVVFSISRGHTILMHKHDPERIPKLKFRDQEMTKYELLLENSEWFAYHVRRINAKWKKYCESDEAKNKGIVFSPLSLYEAAMLIIGETAYSGAAVNHKTGSHEDAEGGDEKGLLPGTRYPDSHVGVVGGHPLNCYKVTHRVEENILGVLEQNMALGHVEIKYTAGKTEYHKYIKQLLPSSDKEYEAYLKFIEDPDHLESLSKEKRKEFQTIARNVAYFRLATFHGMGFQSSVDNIKAQTSGSEIGYKPSYKCRYRPGNMATAIEFINYLYYEGPRPDLVVLNTKLEEENKLVAAVETASKVAKEIAGSSVGQSVSMMGNPAANSGSMNNERTMSKEEFARYEGEPISLNKFEIPGDTMLLGDSHTLSMIGCGSKKELDGVIPKKEGKVTARRGASLAWMIEKASVMNFSGINKIVILGGTNGVNDIDKATKELVNPNAIQELVKIIRRKAPHVKINVGTIPPIDRNKMINTSYTKWYTEETELSAKTYNEYIRNSLTGVEVIDFDLNLDKSLLAGDGLHLGLKGNGIIRGMIQEALKS